MFKKIITNKVIIYLVSRYAIYFIQFISSIIIAINFGPYYFGIWGFISMLINYISYINLGIPYSVNILLVQNKADEDLQKNIVANSIVLTLVLTFLILLFDLYYYYFGISAFDKYEIFNYLNLICLIGIIFHFDSLFGTIYRIKNRIFELAFFQSIGPLLIFVSLFFAKGKALLNLFLFVTLLGELFALLIFIYNKKIPWGGKVNLKGIKIVLNKGFYLFIYNLCFFLIILTTRTFISIYYKVEEFGYFTFAYNLSNAILLFLQALSVVIFPKIVDMLHSENQVNVKKVLRALNINYVTFSYGLIFLAMIIFPVFIHFIPKYQNTITAINLIAITVLLFTNSFGFVSFLMAQNYEKKLAIISLISLILNVSGNYILVFLFKVSYEYLILSTLISYFVFTYLATYLAIKYIGGKTTPYRIFIEFFPFRIFIPYIIAILVVLFKINYLIFLPLLTFIILNKYENLEIIDTFKVVLYKPNIFNLNEKEN